MGIVIATRIPFNRAFVYLSQQGLSIVDGDASLEDARNTPFIKATIYYNKCFRSSHNAFSFRWVVWQPLLH
jgi:hypothetical protein